MNAMFCVARRVGDGKSSDTAWRPFYAGLAGLGGCAIIDQGTDFVGNVFAEDQAVLDAIANDIRTEFSFPIDILGTDMAHDDAFEIPPSTRSKIISWCAKMYGAAFGQAVAANAKSRQHVAEQIMRKASGIPTADPLNGWRIQWKQ